jgi:uncharacterized protein YeaC (DUF1315 family)
MADEQLIPVFIPALAPLLVRAEQLKGAPLTEEEVLRVRDNAICVMMTAQQKAATEEQRGYQDIDPENCWAEWQELREELKQDGNL